MSFSRQLMRLAVLVDQKGANILDVLTGATPQTYRGNPLRFELAVFRGQTSILTLDDLAGLSSITLEVFDAQTGTNPALMSQTVAAANFNSALSLAEWQAGLAAHAAIEFTAQESNLDLDGKSAATYFLVISGITADTAEPVTLGKTSFQLLEDHTPNDVEGPVQGGNIIPGGAVYDGSGEYTLAGLTVNRVYKWSPGANDTDLTSGAQTIAAEGNFTSQDVTALLTGTPGAAVTAIVRADVYLNATESDARYLKKLRGIYDDATQYFTDDLVSDQGGIWLALQDNLNEAPPTLPTTSNAYWQLVVAPGAAGAAGADGANGAAGADGADGADGVDGASAYSYIAFAADDTGTDFNAAPAATRKYIAFKTSAVELTPLATDFAGLWVKYIADDGNAGDMVLADAQTVPGAKSFTDQALKVLNAAGDKSTSLRTAATSNRTVTFPDRSGTLALAPSPLALTWAAAVTLDLAAEPWRTLSLNGDTTFATSNRAAGAYKLVEMIGGAEDYAFTWPAWKWKGEPAPASLAAGKRMQLELWCYGATEADVVARYHMDGSCTSVQQLTLSAEGSTDIKPAADCAWHTVLAGVESDVYDAPFVHDLLLKVLNASEGDRRDVLLDIVDSPHPTVSIWNDTSDTGTALLTIPGADYEQHIKAEFVFVDDAWALLRWSYTDGRLTGNRVSRATVVPDISGTQTIDLDGPSVQEISAGDDVTFQTLDTSRSPAGICKTVLVKLTATADINIAFHADINEVGSSWIASLLTGESCWVNITSTGLNETDTDAAMAMRG